MVAEEQIRLVEKQLMELQLRLPREELQRLYNDEGLRTQMLQQLEQLSEKYPNAKAGVYLLNDDGLAIVTLRAKYVLEMSEFLLQKGERERAKRLCEEFLATFPDAPKDSVRRVQDMRRFASLDTGEATGSQPLWLPVTWLGTSASDE